MKTTMSVSNDMVRFYNLSDRITIPRDLVEFLIWGRPLEAMSRTKNDPINLCGSCILTRTGLDRTRRYTQGASKVHVTTFGERVHSLLSVENNKELSDLSASLEADPQSPCADC
jgi:hypothetical protein